GVCTAPYKTFREDVLDTLGRCMMEPQCWSGREIVIGEMLRRDNDNPAGVWRWWDASGDFSASMFFCLKYLPAERVSGWMRLVLDIPSPHWRAQVIVWAVGAHDTLQGRVAWPEDWNANARPSVQWEWSHCLRAEIAGRANDGSTPLARLLPAAACEDA